MSSNSDRFHGSLLRLALTRHVYCFQQKPPALLIPWSVSAKANLREGFDIVIRQIKLTL
jgi:hypothetical protein